jgi:uncharacterized membrane protein
MGRWVWVALVAGVFVACSIEDPRTAPGGGAGNAGDSGENGGDGHSTQAGAGANSGGPSAGEGGAAANAGQPSSGGMGEHVGGDAQHAGGEVGQPAGGDGGAPATCDPASCENDGFCPDDGGSTCECTGGFTGPHCELPIFEVLEAPADAAKMSASAISADGSVVVGNVTFATHASGFRWTRATGVVLLESLPADDGSAVVQLSADGKVIVGSSSLSGTSFDPVSWSGGLKPGQTLMTTAWKAMTATHVNADGTVVAGSGTLANDSYSAFRWTKATGPVAIGIASATDTASIVAISADGATIVGNSGASSAFVWTLASGSKKLPTLPGDDGAFVQGMSADATTVIGNSLSGASSSKRVLWLAGAAPVPLDPVDPGVDWLCYGGGPIQTCTTVYDDGSVIYTQRNHVPVRSTAAGLETFVGFVGKANCIAMGPTVASTRKVAGTCFGPPLAVIWDADGSKVTELADALTEAGADASKLANSDRSLVRAVSANGDTIVGDDFVGTLVWVARPPR